MTDTIRFLALSEAIKKFETLADIMDAAKTFYAFLDTSAIAQDSEDLPEFLTHSHDINHDDDHNLMDEIVQNNPPISPEHNNIPRRYPKGHAYGYGESEPIKPNPTAARNPIEKASLS